MALLRGIAIALTLAALAPAARGEGRPSYGGTVIGSLLSEPASIDPAAATTHAELTVAGLLFDTLYRLDGGGMPVPHLAAAEPEVSEDGREVRIRLRPGVRFHDGAEVTVADAAASLERVRGSAAGWAMAPVANVRAGADAVVLTLRRQAPELSSLLALPATAVLPGGKAPREGRAIGSGPFKLRTLDRNKRRMVLEAWDGHFAGRPYLDRIELRWYQDDDGEARAYEAGTTQLSQRGAVAFAGHQPKYATEQVEGPATVLAHVVFGRAHAAITASVDLRRALSLSLGRDGLRVIGTGERVVPALDPVPLDLGGPVPARAERRPRSAAARAALQAAARDVELIDDLIDGDRSLSLEVIVDRSRPDDREIAEKVVDALFRLGLSAHIAELDAAVFARRSGKGDFDLAIGQLAAPAALPALVRAAAFAAGGDDWAAQQLARAMLGAVAAERAFERALPILPLAHRAVRVHHRSDVRGVGFDVLGRLGLADLFLHGRPARSRR